MYMQRTKNVMPFLLGQKSSRASGRLPVVLLMLLFCLGELTGAVSSCVDTENDILRRSAELFFRNRAGCTFIETLVNSFSGPFLLMLACLLLGFGAVSMPAELLVPFFHGLGTGVMLADMNAAYGFKGTLVSTVFILPFAVLSAFIVLIAARESFSMSFLSAKRLLGLDKSDAGTVKLYLTKFLVLFAALGVLSLADSLVTYFFAGLWSDFLGI